MCFDCKHQLLTDQNKNPAPSIYFIIKKKRRISIRIIYLANPVVLSALPSDIYSPLSTHPPLHLRSLLFFVYTDVYTHSPAHSHPAHHKKSCINEKKLWKGKNWAIPFSYLNKDSTLFSYTWFPLSDVMSEEKSSQLVLSGCFFFFPCGGWVRLLFGKEASPTAFEMIPPPSPAEQNFFLGFLAHSSAPISIYLLRFWSRPTVSAFFYPETHEVSSLRLPTLASFTWTSEFRLGLCAFRCFDDKQQATHADETLRKWLGTFEHTHVAPDTAPPPASNR